MILSAKNYRRAASRATGYIEIDLQGPLTLIVGDNATGKTTLLDAVHLAVLVAGDGRRLPVARDGRRCPHVGGGFVEAAR